MTSKYRCETCNRPIGLIGGFDDCPLSIPSHLDVALVDYMAVVGCASHSDFQSEREKVLKKVIAIINWCYDEGFPEKTPVVQKLMVLEEELHKDGE
jgi:hypothetical protein